MIRLDPKALQHPAGLAEAEKRRPTLTLAVSLKSHLPVDVRDDRSEPPGVLPAQVRLRQRGREPG
jgi:hypothetical protein